MSHSMTFLGVIPHFDGMWPSQMIKSGENLRLKLSGSEPQLYKLFPGVPSNQYR